MVEKIESSVLKNMTLSDLKKHAKTLKRDGYTISGYKEYSNNPSDMSELRKKIRRTQKAGKSSSPLKKSACTVDFSNITECQKKTSAKKVKELAEECDIEYTTKEKTCKALMKIGVDVSGSNKKKTPTKPQDSSIKKTDDYIKLNKLKKTDKEGNDLQDKARKLKITYGDQDGENISVGKLRKHELILAILKKKVKKSSSPKKTTPKKRTPTPPKKKSKKKTTPKKRTPTPPKKKSKKKTTPTKRTPTPPKKKSKKKTTPTKRTPTPPKKKSKKKDERIDDLPTPWSQEDLKRKRLINKLALATGKSKSYYKEWSLDTLTNRLDGMEIEEDRMITQSNEDDAQARFIMINQIIAVTGEDRSVYKKDSLNDIIDRLSSLHDPEYIDESDSSEESSIVKPTVKPVVSSDDESEDESDSSSDDESDSSSDEKPEEGSEIVDIESSLASVISGNKKIGDLADVQLSILKCMGLLS
jgi:hypothetical protein